MYVFFVEELAKHLNKIYLNQTYDDEYHGYRSNHDINIINVLIIMLMETFPTKPDTETLLRVNFK